MIDVYGGPATPGVALKLRTGFLRRLASPFRPIEVCTHCSCSATNARVTKAHVASSNAQLIIGKNIRKLIMSSTIDFEIDAQPMNAR